ncbi:D-alanyl-D-alanine carboxypeptidase/D-alanyl-D-alanine endopeptidase [Undibacterium sp. SXout7W]|uniref:D-alanyl-D-alanine carboxypeptidase/D-alanyl-D-alanine endopeptidase n=1 Tax=Undibacterium sp. SXout7W TaxID=3413049 RepID=UPI003BF23E37
MSAISPVISRLIPRATPVLVIVACAMLLCLPAIAQQTLPASVQKSLLQAGIPMNALSLAIQAVNVDSTTSQPSLLIQADQAMNPASTMKLLTSLAGLEELGPAFRWKTQFLADQTVKKEVLNGNLYLRGGGDPNLTWEKFAVMLRALRYRGIKKIHGNLVLDRSYFQPERMDIDAPAFDQHPDAYYNIIPDALLIHGNISTFTVESGKDKIDLRLQTPLDKIRINNHLYLTDKTCPEWESEWKSPAIDMQRKDALELTFSGGFPQQCKITHHLNLLDRNLYISHMFRTLWQEMGGSWQGQVIDGITPSTTILLEEHQSDSLADTIRIINKYSDNMMARMLYLTLGAESPDKKSATSLAMAETRIRNWLLKQGINTAGMVLENGSGLSRNERISAAQMAAILQLAARSNWYPEFVSSLPIGGLDGTMRKRLTSSAAELRARIKTGTLKDSVAIAGYVKDLHNHTWIIVAMVNHENAIQARPALDELINWLASGRP